MHAGLGIGMHTRGANLNAHLQRNALLPLPCCSALLFAVRFATTPRPAARCRQASSAA